MGTLHSVIVSLNARGGCGGFIVFGPHRHVVQMPNSKISSSLE